jgi:hypothetical protein
MGPVHLGARLDMPFEVVGVQLHEARATRSPRQSTAPAGTRSPSSRSAIRPSATATRPRSTRSGRTSRALARTRSRATCGASAAAARGRSSVMSSVRAEIRPEGEAPLRHAIYWLPEGPLGAWGAAWLGWDPGTGQEVPHPDPALASLTEEPRRYGVHATLKAPFRLAPGRTEDELAQALAAFAARRGPAEAPGLRLARIGRFLALVPEDDAAINASAAAASPNSTPSAPRPPRPSSSARRAAGLERRRRRTSWLGLPLRPRPLPLPRHPVRRPPDEDQEERSGRSSTASAAAVPPAPSACPPRASGRWGGRPLPPPPPLHPFRLRTATAAATVSSRGPSLRIVSARQGPAGSGSSARPSRSPIPSHPRARALGASGPAPRARREVQDKEARKRRRRVGQDPPGQVRHRVLPPPYSVLHSRGDAVAQPMRVPVEAEGPVPPHPLEGLGRDAVEPLPRPRRARDGPPHPVEPGQRPPQRVDQRVLAHARRPPPLR